MSRKKLRKSRLRILYKRKPTTTVKSENQTLFRKLMLFCSKTPFKKAIIWIWSGIIAILASLAYYSDSKSGFTDLKNDIYPSIPKALFPKISDKFRILILPLFPDQKCEIVHTNYENLIVDRLKAFNDSIGNKLLLHVDSNKTCVNFEMADSIGKFNHADLVLWGNYDKDCNSNSKVRIKHIIYNSEGYLSRARKHHDNGFRDVPNLDSIRKGFLLENTEMVILFLMGVSQYHVGKYEEAIKCLRYFRNYKFDTEIELTLLYCYLNLNDIKNAKE